MARVLTYLLLTFLSQPFLSDISKISGDSSQKIVEKKLPPPLNFDFSYSVDACDPFTISVTGLGPVTSNPFWDFGDGTIVIGQLNVTHTYAGTGDYVVRHSVSTLTETDTLNKNISINLIRDNVVLTADTTICINSSKKILTRSALSFCWTPSTFLDNPNSPEPVTNTTQDITYYFDAQIADGNNLVVNGDFSQGNVGFESVYSNTTHNFTEAEYFVGINPNNWNVNFDNCVDHTTGNSNLMMVNGAPHANEVVWTETITVIPNTNYAFSTWIENLASLNPAVVQFSINGIPLGTPITAGSTACQWKQFFTTWNSGNTTTATISIINKNLIREGNDFALDDISFSQVFVKRDSVKITVEKPPVRTGEDTTICTKTPIQLVATGAQTYSWSPVQGLNDPNIPNPVLTISDPNQYIVTGISANGCRANDTININIHPKATIAVSPTQTICKNTSVQLSASGGDIYNWSPANTLDNPTSNNPIAAPLGNTRYYVSITDANQCNYYDSVQVNIRPDPVFAATGGGNLCLKDTLELRASGGDIYSWQPAIGLDNPSAANPLASPEMTTDYTVTILESTCNQSAVFPIRVTILPLPKLIASKSLDLDCFNDRSQLNAVGADKYSWTPELTLTNPHIANPIATPRVTTSYIVKGTNSNGCFNYDSVTVKVENTNKGGYLMPNAFTPNNDGHNDCYGVRYWGLIDKIEFSIYNRWGQRIFFTRDPARCWDGKVNGIPQSPDVFVYVVKASTLCEPSIFRKGTFALIR